MSEQHIAIGDKVTCIVDIQGIVDELLQSFLKYGKKILTRDSHTVIQRYVNTQWKRNNPLNLTRHQIGLAKSPITTV